MDRLVNAGGCRCTAKSLNIGMVSSPYIETPPMHGAGGIEWVVRYLADALEADGHNVTVYCVEGSESAATVYPLAGAHPDLIPWPWTEANYVGCLIKAVNAAKDRGAPLDVL